jgi:hypothetical protein
MISFKEYLLQDKMNITSDMLWEDVYVDLELQESNADDQQFFDQYLNKNEQLNTKRLYVSIMLLSSSKKIFVRRFEHPMTFKGKYDSMYEFVVDGNALRYPKEKVDLGKGYRCSFLLKSEKDFGQFQTMLSLRFAGYQISWLGINYALHGQ